MKRWEYAVVAEEASHLWTLWLQEQQGPGAELTHPVRNFESDLAMLSSMSRESWELATSIQLHDGLPRLIFKRRL
jgi:hypothetical protein